MAEDTAAIAALDTPAMRDHQERIAAGDYIRTREANMEARLARCETHISLLVMSFLFLLGGGAGGMAAAIVMAFVQ